LCEAARAANAYVVIGVCEKIPNTIGTMFNSQVYIAPDGTLTTLDEDEFDEDTAIAAAARAHALAALASLRELVARRAAPFDGLPG